MSFLVYLAHATGMCFLVNGIPHFVQGVSGNKFQSPFASPPGVGESSAVVNVLWGSFNFAVGFLLLTQVGEFSPGLNTDTFFSLSTALIFALMIARHFSNVRSTSDDD